MSDLIVGLYEDWLWLDERIETITKEIEEISQREGNCVRRHLVLTVFENLEQRVAQGARARPHGDALLDKEGSDLVDGGGPQRDTSRERTR